MRNLYLYIYSTLFLVVASLAQTPRPADIQEGPIAIINGTIHIGNGQVLENGTVLFTDGKITGVHNADDVPDLGGYNRVEADGKHVYPSLIMPSTRLGLEDISAVRPTRDYQEVGEITPNIRSQIAFNTDSDILPTFRFNGILLAQIAPQGGIVSGTSSIMMLDGWNWEDATMKVDDAVHVSWPSKTFGPRWWMGETERRTNENYDILVTDLMKLIADAKSYSALSGSSSVNLKLEAMQGVVNGEQSLFVEVNNAIEMVEAITKLKGAGVPKLVLVGARDAYYVRNLIKEHNIPVILDNIHRRPAREDEAVDYPFRLPGMLQNEGILVALRHDGMLSRGRNLPFYAGTAAGYGLDREEALKMITSNSAQILGISNQVGSIEVGKDASLFICEGDVLDMRSSIITRAFIQGRDVIIEGKQQELFNRYREKYQE